MKLKIGIVLITCLFGSLLKAQDTTFHKFTASGYIHVQYQYAERDADGFSFKLPNSANPCEQDELKGFGRFGIRRGRLKFAFNDQWVQGAFQTNITEKEISVIDVYVNIKDPWLGTNAIKAGIFERPFGHEVAYSSSRNESPERARIIQAIFPDECDLGVLVSLQAPEKSSLNILKLEGGWFAGNGIRPQIDSRMDFIGRLSATKEIGNIVVSGGVSTYLGGVLQRDSSVFVVKDNAFVLDSKTESNIGKYAKRRYTGVDAQFRMFTAAGLTLLKTEYIVGIHPGNAGGAYSFRFTSLAPVEPVYMRKMSGGYVLWSQGLGKTPFSTVIKYDWYHPNTEISGNDIDSKGEINISNIGFGFLWVVNTAIRLSAYYDVVKNETTDKLKDVRDANGKITEHGYASDRKDNVFTLRLQYKF